MGKSVALGCIVLVLVGVLVVGGMAAGAYNKLNAADQGVSAGWAQVENVYQRRADLIPNLVETVKGAANFEKDTLTQVIQARASATQVKLDANSIKDPAAFEKFQKAQDELGERARPPARQRREVPGAEGEPELPRPADAARGDREPDLRRARPVQRRHAGLQHAAPLVPDGHRRELRRLQGSSVLQGRGGLREAAGRQVLKRFRAERFGFPECGGQARRKRWLPLFAVLFVPRPARAPRPAPAVPPAPTRFVTDKAGVIAPDVAARLETQLSGLRERDLEPVPRLHGGDGPGRDDARGIHRRVRAGVEGRARRSGRTG